jgi:hypothetical protein
MECESLQPPIKASLMLQIDEFVRKSKLLPIEVVNEAVRHWLDTVAPAKLKELRLEPFTPRFDGTAVLRSEDDVPRDQ